MGRYIRPSAQILALAGAIAAPTTIAVAQAQDEAIVLPDVSVTATRLIPGPNKQRAGRGAPAPTPVPAASPAPQDGATQPPSTNAAAQSGIVTGTIITGASSTVITSADIARSPGQTVQDILAREPGIQVQSLFGSVNGAQTTVDMRGFGATATSNTLVLVNGRRLNDIDLAGVDLSAIPRNSIERIEITRGNSGGVLYGDGAVGGVINIVTKNGVDLPPSARLQANVGSYRYVEGNASASASNGPFAAA